jgi:hypothetical protein
MMIWISSGGSRRCGGGCGRKWGVRSSGSWEMISLEVLGGESGVSAMMAYSDGVSSDLGERSLVITVILCSFISFGMMLQNWAPKVGSIEEDEGPDES